MGKWHMVITSETSLFGYICAHKQGICFQFTLLPACKEKKNLFKKVRNNKSQKLYDLNNITVGYLNVFVTVTACEKKLSLWWLVFVNRALERLFESSSLRSVMSRMRGVSRDVFYSFPLLKLKI